ncbi:hypothetical protein [Geodermatophilus dictyosporus]|nr:hypothetical protein [Geodermatophilus dictyosporus]
MAPQMPPQGPPPKKSIYKRVWFWLLAGLAVIIIAAAAGGGGDGETSAADPTTPTAEQPADSGGSAAEPPAPAPAPAPPQDDPLEDDGWVLGEVQVETGLVNSLTARITNNESSTRSAFFTITVLGPDGSLVGSAVGAANDVEAGVTATVTLLSSEDLEGDPATFTYELQS